MAIDFSTPCSKASASATAAGVLLTLPSAAFSGFLVEYVSSWMIVIDTAAGTVGGASLPLVALQILNPATLTYQTLTKLNGVAFAGSYQTLANDVAFWVINGPLIGLQLNVTTWGTPTGTLYGYVFGI